MPKQLRGGLRPPTGASRARPLETRKAARGTKRRQRPNSGSPNQRGALVTIRAYNEERLVEATVVDTPALARVSDEWTYRLRSRPRWIDKPRVRWSLRDRALADLGRIGVEREFLKELVSVENGHVEIELHAFNKKISGAREAHEVASEFPWEYLLSAATRGVGRHRPIIITRLLRNGYPVAQTAPPRKILFVESAPGRLEGAYDFRSERARIKAAAGADDDSDDARNRTITISRTDEVHVLKRKVRSGRYDVIHVTGIDNHQANVLISQEIGPSLYDGLKENKAVWTRITDGRDQVLDGMVLRETNESELPVPYEELADILIDPKEPPALVTLNFYHSGARTARELVRRGAGAALGFLDEIDDDLAELFFQAFYWAWCRPGSSCDVPSAFLEAWNAMKGQRDRMHGTAIVMWLGHSALEQHSCRTAASSLTADDPSVDPDQVVRPTDPTRISIEKLLQVECDTDAEINYSLLHNQRPLLSKLTLTKLVKEPLEDITVNVELNLGARNYPYRSTCITLKEPLVALAESVRIPLTAALPRALRERVQSTVYVKVTLCGRTAYEDTKRVTLIPVDEWLDDTEDNPWLPSFVLPRDPAILRIVGSARRYLIGILDDPAAGFDGYQSIDLKAADPYAGVDSQVRALWTALVNDYRLQYINPPPSYSEQTQRLRTPSDILASNSGTCIDLALLLASCLEYVDIYPVVILLNGHAFAGYWRSEEMHDAFVEVERVPASVPKPGGTAVRNAEVPIVDKYGWRLTRLHYDEILSHVAAGDLVLLEATFLTGANRFADAIEEGRANLRSRKEFDSLLDIQLARSAEPPVTPLPVLDTERED